MLKIGVIDCAHPLKRLFPTKIFKQRCKLLFAKTVFIVLIAASTPSLKPSVAWRTSLYNSLDPNSLSKQLAFYELYADTPEGQCALTNAWKLLGVSTNSPLKNAASLNSIPTFATNAIISLVNRPTFIPATFLSEEELSSIEHLASHLPNRQLKGHTVTTEREVLQLTSDEIDLSRALLISQLEDNPEKENQIRQYEALLDLMAIQILAHLQNDGGLSAPPLRKIEEMNHFIFNELHFRFPPCSSYAPEIDQYTFLPSVLDSRRGVCLGVSILYLSLATRICLPLEIITPPGHILVRYRSNDGVINIETTARGANLPTETYESLYTKSLQQRTMKQAVGLAHFNQASVFSQKKEYEKAVAAYRKALLYLPGDILITELLGYHLLFTGQFEEGKKLLNEIKDKFIPGHISLDPMPSDYLNGKVDTAGIKAVFMQVDESQSSILEKQRAIQGVINLYPEFRSGLVQLSTCWLQLNREQEALEILEKYHSLDPTDPVVEYYLAALYATRYDYNKAWVHLKIAENLVHKHDHHPSALKDLRDELIRVCPE